MGYYSSVAFTTNEKGFNKLNKLFEKYGSVLREWYKVDILEEDENHCKTYKVYNDDIKFYDMFEEVKPFRDFMADYDEEEHINYSFVRIGEEREDIEYESGYSKELYSEGNKDIFRVEPVSYIEIY